MTSADTYAPTPNPTPAAWTGNKVELLAADAWAQCSYVGASSTMAVSDVDASDAFLTGVGALMASAMGLPAGTPPSFSAWVAFRANAANYSAPQGTTAQGVTLDTSVVVPSFSALSGNGGIAVRTAIVNYCIAQRLRNTSPGASVLEALSMTLSEQQQLLQIEHERAQIAMLQYALLGLAFTSPSRPTGLVKTLGITTEEGRLLQWAADPANAATLEALGKDFAGVVQLDLAASQELAELFSHQAAADEARAGGSVSVADALWGKGSWRQRLMGLLYGGDPLVSKVGGSLAGDAAPGIGNTAVYTTRTAGDPLFTLDNPAEVDWPQRYEMPYAQVSATDAHVAILLAIAQQLDREQQRAHQADPSYVPVPVVALKLATPAANGCSGTDITTSARRLYATVEALLETKDCEQKDASGSCTVVTPSSLMPQLDTSSQSFVLWKKHRIALPHATTLVAKLDDLAGDNCGTPWPDGARVGALDVGGQITPATVDRDTSWRAISSDARFTPRALEESAGLFSRLSRFRMPKVIDYAAPLDQQGLVSGAYFNHAERKRALGTIQAFAATRDAMISASEQGTAAGGHFFKYLKQTNGALVAAVGDGGVAISAHAQAQGCGKPSGFFGPDVSPKQPAILSQTVAGAFVAAPAQDAAYDWDVDVTVPPSDDWWNNSNAGQYTLIAIPNDPHAATFARFPTASRDGKTLTSLLALPTVKKSAAAPTTDTAPTDAGTATRWHFRIALPRTARWTFLVQKVDASNTRLLASNVTMASFSETWDGTNNASAASHSYYTATALSKARPLDGQYLAFGGQFGVMALRTLAPDSNDPTLPAFDGFGLPRHYVPAPDPHSLVSNDLGGSTAQPLVFYHLDRATQMAQDAQDEVNKVLTGLLQKATDKATAEAAATASRTKIQLQRVDMCGTPPGGTTPVADPERPNDPPPPLCDTQMEQKKMDFTSDFVAAIRKSVPNFPDGRSADGTLVCTDAPPDLSIASLKENDDWKKYIPAAGAIQSVADTLNGPPNADLDAKRKQLSTWLDCKTYQLLKALDVTAMIARSVRIANELAPGSNTVPAFSQVNGGKLQQAFIDQWTALAQARNIVNEIVTSNGATKQHLIGFVAGFQAVQGKAAQNCSPGAMADAAIAGISAGVSMGCMPSASLSFSAGPLIAQQQKCNDLKGDIDSAAQTAVANMWDSMTALMAQASKLTDASRAIQKSSADIAQIMTQTDIAAKQAELDEAITDAPLQTTFGLWRSIHNADLIQAQTVLKGARQQALLARRAIESTYVVDLSTMYASEFGGLEAPATWANDVYTMDLDIAAVAGLNVGTSIANKVYPYSLKDYVRNLSSFVHGYFQGGRTILPSDNAMNVVNLVGPAMIDSTDTVNWSVFCPDATGGDGTWIEVAPAAAASLDQTMAVWQGRLKLACPRPVLRAKVMFSLDPWGRLGLAAPHALNLDKQFNTRWQKLAVNTLGTAVCDVPAAGTPDVDQLCVTTHELPTTLTQIAPAWTTDYSATWTPLGFGTASLINVAALTLGWQFGANGWNDPTNGSWVTTVARRGFFDRPMGGFYELELNPGNDPSFRLAHLEGVQILYTAGYWQHP